MTYYAECAICHGSQMIASGIRELTKESERSVLLKLGWSVIPRYKCKWCKEIEKKYPVK